MSRQVRYRMTALVLGGVLLGAPLLTNGTASADQVAGGGRQVVFGGGGGMLSLSCRSQPDVESMTVPADSTIRVVNRTGYSAKLQLAGTAKGSIPENGTTDVVFRRGTTAVLLSPSCALGDESIPLLVTATPSDPAAMPDPIPAPTDSSTSTMTQANSGAPAASTAGSTLPDSVAPPATTQQPATVGVAGRPTLVRAGAARPGPAAIVATTAGEAMPQGGSASHIKTRLLRGTGTAPPAFAGMPLGEHKAIVAAVPPVSLSPAADAAPAAPAMPASEIAAAEPVASMQPMSEPGPAGLLALTAIVCVIGVAVGAIRAFVSQRASRTMIA
jgi:hypothetical protein